MHDDCHALKIITTHHYITTSIMERNPCLRKAIQPPRESVLFEQLHIKTDYLRRRARSSAELAILITKMSESEHSHVCVQVSST